VIFDVIHDFGNLPENTTIDNREFARILFSGIYPNGDADAREQGRPGEAGSDYEFAHWFEPFHDWNLWGERWKIVHSVGGRWWVHVENFVIIAALVFE
jgi:hypothetical protein